MKNILYMKNNLTNQNSETEENTLDVKETTAIYRDLFKKTRIKEDFSLLETYKSDNIDDFLMVFQENSSEEVKALKKKLLVYELTELLSPRGILMLELMKELNFVEIYSLTNRELIKLDTYINLFKGINKEEEPTEEKKKGRPFKELGEQEHLFVEQWIKGELSLQECMRLTGLSHTKLYKLRNYDEFSLLVPKKEENTEEYIEKFVRGKVSLDLVMNKLGYTRVHIFRLVDKFLAENDVFNLAGKKKEFEFGEELEKATFENIDLFKKKKNLKEVCVVKYSFDTLKYSVYKVQRLGKKSINLEGSNVSKYTVEHQNYYILPKEKNPEIMIKAFITERLSTFDMEEQKFHFIENLIFMNRVKEYIAQKFPSFEEKEQFINHIECELYNKNKGIPLLIINKAVRKLEDKLLNIWRDK